MLAVAGSLLEVESAEKVDEREKYMAEKCPPLELPYSKDELMVSHHKNKDECVEQRHISRYSDPDTDVRMKHSEPVPVAEPVPRTVPVTITLPGAIPGMVTVPVSVPGTIAVTVKVSAIKFTCTVLKK